MKRLSVLVAMFLLASPVCAQEVAFKSSCKVVTYEQHRDKGAEYQPGVDVHGQPVVSAGVNKTIKAIEYPFEIPVEIDIIKFLDLDVPASAHDALRLRPDVARFTVYEDGRIEYNGQDVSSSVTYSCSDEVLEQEESAQGVRSEVLLQQPEKDKNSTQKAVNPVVSGEKLEGQSP